MDNTRADSTLNPEQLKASRHLDGPLLILAGAGSGKTRVITMRVAYLIEEIGIAPWNIMAITFTNKAAREMKERVERMAGPLSREVHIATFHSTCVRILRRFIDRIGYDRGFDIYDADDSKSLMKEIFRNKEINTKRYREKTFLAKISHLKEELTDPEQYRETALAGGDMEDVLTADIYAEYQRRLRMCNALDFDDLISQTVRLFREHGDVLEYYQNRWKYLMVDEYQDTNKAQFVFISLLAQKYRNLCVVGDDDQSIYRFRGADIGNILNFEKIFPETEVIRLEQNYRSTQNILDAANSVISNNEGRKSKRLWTERSAGEPVSVKRFDDSRMEAKYIADDIGRKKRQGIFRYSDSAVLYRTNAQSRAIEEQLLYENIPYTIIGGTNFYSRKEIKDIIAYLRVITNSSDDIAVKRIINVPKRGIGQTTIGRVEQYALSHDMSFFDVARMADKVPGIGKGGIKIRQFIHLILEMKKHSDTLPPTEMIDLVLKETGYEEQLRQEGTDEAEDRLENIGELISKAAAYENSSDESLKPTLGGFLEEIALVADIDAYDGQDDHAVLMTLHSAKGLEFPNVYIAGMDEDLFPSYQAASSPDPADMEEERRLCYVGITRAKDHLTLTGARMRMMRGQMQWYRESRFISELPEAAVEETMRGTSRSPYSAAPKPWEMPRKKSSIKKPFFLTSEAPSQAASLKDLGYEEGDTVRHVKFGKGKVLQIRDGGRDKEVTVDFEKYGVKKMFAGFAKLERFI